MASQEFGEVPANAMAALLEAATSDDVLDEIGTWALPCKSGDVWLAKVRQI